MTGLIENGVVITASGYEQLARELELLRTDAREELAERLRETREDGDLADNPALYDVLEEQAHLERRIMLLEARLSEARVAAPATDGVASVGNVVLVRDRVHREALDAAVAAGARVVSVSEASTHVDEYALVLDGILGIGRLADRRLRGSARALVERLLALPDRPRVVAVDVPSGLDPDDGTADAIVLPADVTVTFGALKAGLVRGRGPGLAGRVHLVDLGLEPYLRRAHPAVTAAIEVVREDPRTRA